MAGFAMSCLPVRSPPSFASGGEEELEEGPPSARGWLLSRWEAAVARWGLGMACGAGGKEGAARVAAVAAARGRRSE